MNSKDVGNLGEHIALVELFKHEIQVSRPIGDNSRYDLILDIKGTLFTCQIKSTNSATEDYATFSLQSSQVHRGNGRQSYDVDCFILVDIVNNKVFMLDTPDTKSMIIRYVKPPGTPLDRVNMYDKFLLSTYMENLP